MDESIFEDLEKLFEECDDVVNSFNKTVADEEQLVGSQSANATILYSEGDNEVICNNKVKVIDSGETEHKTEVPESNVINKSICHIAQVKHEPDGHKEECDTVEPVIKKNESEIEVHGSNIVKIGSETGDIHITKCGAGDKPDLSEISVKKCWKRKQEEESIKDVSLLDEQSSKEEGECTETFVEEKSLGCTIVEKVKKKKTGPEINYSSFIDSSKEDGECSTTSFEDNELEITVKEASPSKMTKVCSGTYKENKGMPVEINYEQELNMYKNLRKRKRSLSECNENTPKRRHLLITDCEDALSPIGCVPSSADKGRNILEVADSPMIESKFRLQETKLNFQEKVVSSSTPLSTSQKPLLPSEGACGTPLAAANSGKQNKLAKREILKVVELSDSDSDFHGFSDDNETTDKCQTVDELIAEITQLCEDCEKTLESERSDDEQVGKGPDKPVSKIQLDELLDEWKTKSSQESGTDSEDDEKTLVEDVNKDSQTEGTETAESDIENYTVLSAVGSYKKDENENDNDEDKVGRFKGEVTVSRIEDEKGNETNRVVIDMILCDNDDQELQYGDDLLNLDDYDDEGFVDENVLEKSHLTKDLSTSVKANVTVENNNNIQGKQTAKQPDTLLELIPSLEIERKDNVDSIGKADTDINENVVRGLDYAAFDTSIYRRNENTTIEREICKRWRTHGSADPDVNLTVASTKRNKCKKAGKKPEAGYLEGDHVVCTYLYEEEILSTFKRYGKTTGQSDLCFMTLDNLLNKLYNQKEILENMNKQSLIDIKQTLQWQLTGTKERHMEEMNALRYRQTMEDDQFRFTSRIQFNPIEFQNRIMQLRQDHLFQQERLKEHHQKEFCAVRARGLDILNQEINRHSVQCEPIGQLIEQLEKPEAYASLSPNKYGPPIVVSLRKGPCRANNGKHSSVPVCLSAGIAQAVSLEDDLYDHYYGY